MSKSADWRCSCGVNLREWRTEGPAGRVRPLWAADLADVVAYQARRATHHDVLDARGRRLVRGRCADPPGLPAR